LFTYNKSVFLNLFRFITYFSKF